jgi:hypothetical protein
MFQDRKGKGDFGWEWRRLCSLVLMQIREFQRERKKEIQRERERERERLSVSGERSKTRLEGS